MGNMNNLIGVMQGRLLPKYKGRYQAHPVGYWKDEFDIANKVGLNCIEFILDYEDASKNPLLKKGGIEEIKRISDESNVFVKTVCADYFMQAPLHSLDDVISHQSQEVMIELINNVAELGVTDIVLPCVDKSSLTLEPSFNHFLKKLAPIIDVAEKRNINISLETDLPPQHFLELLDFFQSDFVKVNYDIGNSAALGFNPVEELEAYGNRISDIHIKDRVLNGGPVELGHGNGDLYSFFNKLKDYNYQGPFIMQAFRDDQGVDIFKTQLDWILNIMTELNYR
jgi:L-ribulose-5-phosphate 3-epimerase